METLNISKSSDDFLNTIMGEWVILNLSDDDCSESETLSTSKEGSSSRPPSTDDGNSCDDVVHCHFRCGTCGETIQDYCLPKHHYLEHPDVPFNMQLYEPIKIEEKIQSILCNAEIIANQFDSHQNECQVENWLSLTENECNEKSEASSEYNSIQSGQDSSNAIASLIFKCEACGALVFEEKLEEHHETIHQDIPQYVELFELYTEEKQELCNICEKWVENIAKHRDNCHEMKQQDTVNDGLCNVFMTENEFEQMRHRIDEVDGRYFLRESESTMATDI